MGNKYLILLLVMLFAVKVYPQFGIVINKKLYENNNNANVQQYGKEILNFYSTPVIKGRYYEFSTKTICCRMPFCFQLSRI
jgi:hypothetical protein